MAVGLAAAMLLAGCGGDGKKSSAPTTVQATTTTLSQAQLDQQKAQRVVLTNADVPGYTVSPPDPQDVNLQTEANPCDNRNPLTARLGETDDAHGASSPDFTKGGTITISSSATFGDTEDQARAAFADLGVATFPACFAKAFVDELKKDSAVSNATATGSKLPALTVGDQSLGYRITSKFRTSGTPVTVYSDFTFIRSGRGVAGLSITSSPAFPEAERVRLATLLATRLAAP